MDLTQIGLGAALLVLAALTVAGPATDVPGPVVYLLTGVTLVVTGYALLIGLWRAKHPHRH